jgi:peptidoglycan/LPS O-acetylase OafA/YrhL
MISAPSHPLTGAHARLGELDALRGIAAMVVVLFHYSWQMRYVLPGVPMTSWSVPWGKYGVELFFAISGFVIFMTLERTRTSSDFLVSRFARLFPAYWAGIFITTLAVHGFAETTMMQPPAIVAANLTMLQGYMYLPSVDGVYWSLTVELGFYASMLALWRLGLLARIEWILIGWIALKLLWWRFPMLPSRLSMVLVLDYIPLFAVGVAAYRVRSGVRRWSQQIPVLLVGLGVTWIVDPSSSLSVYLLVTGVFFALTKGWLTRLQHPVLLWLGGLSYPLYLIHENVGFAIIHWLADHGFAPTLSVLVAIAVSLGLSQLVHTAVEQPALRTIRTWWKVRKAAKVSAQSVPS